MAIERLIAISVIELLIMCATEIHVIVVSVLFTAGTASHLRQGWFLGLLGIGAGVMGRVTVILNSLYFLFLLS